MKKIYETEVSFKYILYFTLILVAFLAYNFALSSQSVSIEGLILFFLPYVFIILSLTLCWDMIAEESKTHKILGVLLFLASVALAIYIFRALGMPSTTFVETMPEF